MREAIIPPLPAEDLNLASTVQNANSSAQTATQASVVRNSHKSGSTVQNTSSSLPRATRESVQSRDSDGAVTQIARSLPSAQAATRASVVPGSDKKSSSP